LRALAALAAAVVLYAGQARESVASEPQTKANSQFEVPHPDHAKGPSVAQLALRPGERVGLAVARRLGKPSRDRALYKLIALFDATGRFSTSQLNDQALNSMDKPLDSLVSSLAPGVDALLIDRANRWHFAGQMRQRLSDARGDEPAMQSFRQPIMSTAIDVVLPAGPEAERQAQKVFAIFRAVESEMNEWKPESPTSLINRQAGIAPVAVSAELRQVLRVGLEVSRKSHGAFDPTWAALWGLWDFSAKSQGRVPTADELAPRLPLIDYRQVQVDEAAGTVKLAKAGMKLGLGGIAKGWALAQAGIWLRDQGVASFSLSAGGQVLVAGLHGQRPWRVGIRHPRGPASAVLAVLSVRDASVSTSGDYEHFFERDGIRYHHILDTRTGQPARGLQSASVVTADATVADALSTALMVLGREKALKLVAHWPGVECVLVDDAGKLWLSNGLQGKVELVGKAEMQGKVELQAR
jgi:thiamine biosynthesis lipoprotein